MPLITSSAPSSSTTSTRAKCARSCACRAGYGKVAVVEELEERLAIAPDRTIYIGDGSSDVHVMLHVNNRARHTIAVSENKQLARIAKSTILSDDASSVMVPILEQVLGWGVGEIRSLFESYGLTLHEWEKARTDRVTVRESSLAAHARLWPEWRRPSTVEYLGWAATAVFVSSYFFAAARNAEACADARRADVDRLRVLHRRRRRSSSPTCWSSAPRAWTTWRVASPTVERSIESSLEGSSVS